jgi:hypothetical protein
MIVSDIAPESFSAPMRRFASWLASVPELAVTHASNCKNGGWFATSVEPATSIFTRSVIQKRASPGRVTRSSRYGTSRSRIESPHKSHRQRRRIQTRLNANNPHGQSRKAYRSRSAIRSDDTEPARQLGKICCTHGKLCWSDQQIFPSHFVEILEVKRVRSASRIPKTFLLRNIPTLALSFLISLILSSSFQKASLAQNSDSNTIADDDLRVLE